MDNDDELDSIGSWSDLHSWYALIRDFVFDTSDEECLYLPGGRTRVVVTRHGLVQLAKLQPNALPLLTPVYIQDKSKSDTLAKTITCWQATWFCVQRVFRLAEDSSISLLELNVFGHCICAFAVSIIWWNKPKDIREPTILVSHSD